MIKYVRCHAKQVPEGEAFKVSPDLIRSRNFGAMRSQTFTGQNKYILARNEVLSRASQTKLIGTENWGNGKKDAEGLQVTKWGLKQDGVPKEKPGRKKAVRFISDKEPLATMININPSIAPWGLKKNGDPRKRTGPKGSRVQKRPIGNGPWSS